MKQSVTVKNGIIKIVRTETIKISDIHKQLLQDALKQGYVELRGSKYTDAIGMVKYEVNRAFYDLCNIGVLNQLEDAWTDTGKLVSDKKNLIKEILGE